MISLNGVKETPVPHVSVLKSVSYFSHVPSLFPVPRRIHRGDLWDEAFKLFRIRRQRKRKPHSFLKIDKTSPI